MTIEERIECALDDLESLILEGHSGAHALEVAAEPYGIKPEVLKVRAASAGDFDGYVERILETKARAEANQKIMRVAQEFRRVPFGKATDEPGRLRAALTTALGREPTDREYAICVEADEAARKARSVEFLADVRAMRNLPPRLHTD